MDFPSSALGIASTAAVLLLSLGALARALWRGAKRLVRIHDLIEKELNNNGGSSMKDQIESANRYAKEANQAAKAAVEVAARVEMRTAGTEALAMGHERELGAINNRLRQLEGSDIT